MNLQLFQSRLIRNKPVRLDQLIAFGGWGDQQVRPNEFVKFGRAQQASIAKDKPAQRKGRRRG